MKEVKNFVCCVALGTTILTNIPLMKGTVPKRLDICYDFGTFKPFSTFISLYKELNAWNLTSYGEQLRDFETLSL